MKRVTGRLLPAGRSLGRVAGDTCSARIAASQRLGAVEWLQRAATPTFVTMAMLSGVRGVHSMDMPGPVTHGLSALGGMTAMYALMAAFHAAPWFKKATQRGRSRRCRATDCLPGEARMGQARASQAAVP